MIELSRPQISFAEGLIDEEVGSLWEPWRFGSTEKSMTQFRVRGHSMLVVFRAWPSGPAIGEPARTGPLFVSPATISWLSSPVTNTCPIQSHNANLCSSMPEAPMPKTPTATAIPIDQISRSIIIVRGHKVLLDAELAALYGVDTRVLIQAVKRNMERFPDDFMLSLTTEEWQVLRSQTVTSNPKRGGRRYPPYAFTEQGVAMLSSVLNSPRAIAVNIQIMRAFVQLRALVSSNKELARQFANLETRLNKKLADHDDAIAAILSAIRQLMNPPAPKRRGIGFTAKI